MQEEKKQPIEIKVDIDEETSKGNYSNLAMISHSESEFVLDFMFFTPQTSKNIKVVSRVIVPAVHAKKLAAALVDNVQKYEKKFGQIKEPVVADNEPKPKYYN